MTLYESLRSIEQEETLHLARLLILIGAFAGRNGNGTINGLTKLAKLDFLVRYPKSLQKALSARGIPESDVMLRDYEGNSVESKMVRFKYGPWDFRYRRQLNTLIAKGLAYAGLEGRTVVVGLTQEGQELSAALAATPEFEDTALRSRLVKRHFDLGATNLMNFIYDTFPDLSDMKLGEEIRHEISD